MEFNSGFKGLNSWVFWAIRIQNFDLDSSLSFF